MPPNIFGEKILGKITLLPFLHEVGNLWRFCFWLIIVCQRKTTQFYVKFINIPLSNIYNRGNPQLHSNNDNVFTFQTVEKHANLFYSLYQLPHPLIICDIRIRSAFFLYFTRNSTSIVQSCDMITMAIMAQVEFSKMTITDRYTSTNMQTLSFY